jgi:hypothetical protein
MTLTEWNIQPRATLCAVTNRPFTEGEQVYSALYWKNGGYLRVDVCEASWRERNDNLQPLSAWQAIFEPAPPTEEAIKKDDAESLLRVILQEKDPARRNVGYILAIMLERKKILKPLDRQEVDGEPILIYEHLPSGETWIVTDPRLRLDQLEPVQEEVSQLLKTPAA